ncbi:unnamed protein product [Urochloa decumbens]|uniref:Peptidase A1 domain-containing protein n=1 Tax=Urochloa decumbens TaxID=240449 RepID=A0ABC8VUQ1_9POAL
MLVIFFTNADFFLLYYVLCTDDAVLIIGARYIAEFRLSKDGAFHFPVFHRKHPCLDPSPAVHAASVSDAGTVIGDDEIHRGKYLMAISLGTPAVFSLVTIDTGSTLSWVNCERCQISCPVKAGPRFDPHISATYRQVGCSNADCVDIHVDNGVPYGCNDETDTCIYSVRYGSHQYSAGKLGRDRLALGDNFTVVDDFIFGCSEDDRFYGLEAGVIGFGNKSYSFFNQMARQTSYSAFAYCFPSDHQAEGFLVVGPYPQRLELVTPLMRGYGGRRWYVYSLLLLGMAVDGKRLEVDPTVDTRQIMVVDSGTEDTFVSPLVFYALSEAVTSAMGGKGYYREYGSEKVCFRPFQGSEPAVTWRDFPTVEMQFLRATLKLPPENVFHQQSADRICLAFQPDTSGVRDVRILGNKALRSFRVVYDLEKMNFGFQPRAC